VSAHLAIRALLFDMDGLLLNSEDIYVQAYVELSQQMGCPHPAEVFRQFIGVSSPLTVRTLVQDYGFPCTPEELNQKQRQLYYDLLERLQPEPFPGARETMEAGRRLGLKLGLVTSTTARTVDITIRSIAPHLWPQHDAAGWRKHFHTVATADRVERVKPAPDLYQLAIREVGLQPQE